jgi:hypothetical protein
MCHSDLTDRCTPAAGVPALEMPVRWLSIDESGRQNGCAGRNIYWTNVGKNAIIYNIKRTIQFSN